MFKIVMYNKDGTTHKTRFYQTSALFERWLVKHMKLRGFCYTVKGYQCIDGKWEEVCNTPRVSAPKRT